MARSPGRPGSLTRKAEAGSAFARSSQRIRPPLSAVLDLSLLRSMLLRAIRYELFAARPRPSGTRARSRAIVAACSSSLLGKRRASNPSQDSVDRTTVPCGAGSILYSCRAGMPRVWPDHPKVRGGSTSRNTEEIIRELAFQRNDVPSAKGPAILATFTAEFHVGHPSTSIEHGPYGFWLGVYRVSHSKQRLALDH